MSAESSGGKAQVRWELLGRTLFCQTLPSREPAGSAAPSDAEGTVVCYLLLCANGLSGGIEYEIRNVLMEGRHLRSKEQLQCSLIVLACKTWEREVMSLPTSYPERGSAGCCVDEPSPPKKLSSLGRNGPRHAGDDKKTVKRCYSASQRT